PAESAALVGEEVEVALTYESVAPKGLTTFSVFYPWLTLGCQCEVQVRDDLDCFLCVPHFAAGQYVHPQVEPASKVGRGVTVSTEDVILPGSAFDVHWTRRPPDRAGAG